jgi:hypothetical protein
MKSKRIRWVVAVVGAAVLTVTIGLATVGNRGSGARPGLGSFGCPPAQATRERATSLSTTPCAVPFFVNL